MLLNLIAIDPGGETGVAWACYKPTKKSLAHSAVVNSFKVGLGRAWQVAGDPNEQALQVYKAIEECILKAGGKQDTYPVRTHVICESFIPPASRARKKSILLPVQVAAKIHYHLWLEQLPVKWVWQQPNERTVVTHDMLRKWKLWQPGEANNDAMAALQHLIVYARKLENESA